MHIESATRADWKAIEMIYREGIRTELATLTPESEVPDGDTWFAGKIPNLIFKAVDDDGMMLGWAALTAVSKRSVYAGVAEVSVYITQSAWGRGIGFMLLDHIVKASENAGIWTLTAGIFPENVASVNLHKKAGFRIVGTREKIGKLNGVWRDVLLMERRSPVVF
ncbi:MAG: N-acetyltransferase [Chloroflexi bacterium]|nr:MAG: N-acetyltransferase [Chloroflexota bacterium]